MVGSVGGAYYYSYQNQLQGIKSPAAATPPASKSTVSSTTAQSQVSSLLNSPSGFSAQVLSLLQENASGSFDPITSLLGGTSTNNALTGIYANVYASVSAAALTQAKDSHPKPSVVSQGSVFELIKGQTQASIAYNKTIVQNAANVAKANNYGPDGVTPLVG